MFKLDIKCDKCGSSSRIEINLYARAELRQTTLEDLPARFSFYKLPGDKLVCFECASKVMETLGDD